MKKSFYLASSLAMMVAYTGCVGDDVVINEIDAEQTLPSYSEGNVQFTLVSNVGSGISTRAADHTGDANNPNDSYADAGNEDEYQVNTCTLYLFESGKNGKLKQIVDLKNIGKSVAGSGTNNVYYYHPDRTEVADGTYDILAIANQKSDGAISAEVNVTTKMDFLTHIDSQSYATLASRKTTDGLVMTNRGDENLSIYVPKKAKTQQVIEVPINLERVVARVDITKDASFVNTANSADINLTGYTLINQANKFYTYRHVAALKRTDGEPVWDATVHYGNIPSGNGYVIDPFFFDKVAAGTATNYSSFYLNPRSNYEHATYKAMGSEKAPAINYTLENCMKDSLQKIGNTTCVIFKAEVTPRMGYVAKLNGNVIEAVSSENEYKSGTLYYFNGRFYTSKEALRVATQLDVTGLTREQIIAKGADVFNMTDGKTTCYYTYRITHWASPNVLNDIMEFGIVRNCCYVVNVTKVLNIGTSIPEGEDENDDKENLLQVTINVRPWLVIKDEDVQF